MSGPSVRIQIVTVNPAWDNPTRSRLQCRPVFRLELPSRFRVGKNTCFWDKWHCFVRYNRRCRGNGPDTAPADCGRGGGVPSGSSCDIAADAGVPALLSRRDAACAVSRCPCESRTRRRFAGWIRPGDVSVRVCRTKIVGRVTIRHRLNECLEREGGHIGYVVVPEFRRRGYATGMLRAALDIAWHSFGLRRVLVTCDDDNMASIRTIEKNGGVLQDRIAIEGTDKLIRRYPEQDADRERSLCVLRSLPADIWVTNHARTWGRYREYIASSTPKLPRIYRRRGGGPPPREGAQAGATCRATLVAGRRAWGD